MLTTTCTIRVLRRYVIKQTFNFGFTFVPFKEYWKAYFFLTSSNLKELLSYILTKSRVTTIITCGKNLSNAYWLRQRAFFLNHESTFGNQRGHDYLMLIPPFGCLRQRFIDCNLTEWSRVTLLTVLWEQNVH